MLLRTLSHPQLDAKMRLIHHNLGLNSSTRLNMDTKRFYYKMGYLWNLITSLFVPVPPGFGVVTSKVYEILAAGSIPIIEPPMHTTGSLSIPVADVRNSLHSPKVLRVRRRIAASTDRHVIRWEWT